MINVRRLGEHGEIQLAAGSRQANSHMPAASLGHYASLSFVVVGRRWDWGFGEAGSMVSKTRGLRSEDRRQSTDGSMC